MLASCESIAMPGARARGSGEVLADGSEAQAPENCLRRRSFCSGGKPSGRLSWWVFGCMLFIGVSYPAWLKGKPRGKPPLLGLEADFDRLAPSKSWSVLCSCEESTQYTDLCGLAFLPFSV